MIFVEKIKQARTNFFRTMTLRPDYFGAYGKGATSGILNALDNLDRGKVIPPGLVEIHLTDRCNYKCTFCVGQNLKKGRTAKEDAKQYFNEETTKDVIRQVSDYWKESGFQGEIKLCGMSGDPLMVKDLVRTAIEEAGENRIVKKGVSTNGFNITPGTWEYLNRLSYIFWSRNATSNATAAMISGVGKSITAKADKRVYKYSLQRPNNLLMVMGFVIRPDTINEATDAINFAQDRGLSGIRFKLDQTLTKVPEGYEDKVNDLRETLIEKEMESLDGQFRIWAPLIPFDFSPRPGFQSKNYFGSCLSQLNIGVISDTGKVYGCYWGPQSNPDMHFGSLTKMSFKNIWEGKRRLNLIGAFPSENCETCPTGPWIQNNLIEVNFRERIEKSPFLNSKAIK